MAVISRDQANMVLESLIMAGYSMTFTESRGGVLRQAQYTLYACVDEESLDDVLGIIREHCRAQVEVATEDAAGRRVVPDMIQVTANLGGAVVFVWDVQRVETY